ncbi:hypothetical protein CR513_52035, partial [Mucuna pruriens]
MTHQVALKIKEELEKQWNIGFLAVVEYPQWVANIVPIPKKYGKVRSALIIDTSIEQVQRIIFLYPTLTIMPFGLKNVGATY